MIEGCRIAAGIDQDQVIVDGIKLVTLEPVDVIDQRPITTKFLNKDPIAQTLRRQQIRLGGSQPNLQLRRFITHQQFRLLRARRTIARVLGAVPGFGNSRVDSTFGCAIVFKLYP